MILILFSNLIYAQSTIECSSGSCVIPNELNLKGTGGDSDFSSFDIFPNSEDIQVITPLQGIPRSARMRILNNSPIGNNLSINLSSTRGDADSGDSILTGDIFDNLSIILDGSSGLDGEDSSFICAENFKNGVFGQNARDAFEQRRDQDQNLSDNVCDNEDIDYLRDNTFSCPSGSELTNTTIIDVEQIVKKRKCSAVGSRSRCLRRRMELTCNLNQRHGGTNKCCNDGSASSSTRAQPWRPTPINWNCNPSACNTTFSGASREYTVDVWEDEYWQLNSSEACTQYLNNGFTVSYDNNFLNRTSGINYSVVNSSLIEVSNDHDSVLNLPIPSNINGAVGNVVWVLKEITGTYQNINNGWHEEGAFNSSNMTRLGGRGLSNITRSFNRNWNQTVRDQILSILASGVTEGFEINYTESSLLNNFSLVHSRPGGGGVYSLTTDLCSEFFFVLFGNPQPTRRWGNRNNNDQSQSCKQYSGNPNLGDLTQSLLVANAREIPLPYSAFFGAVSSFNSTTFLGDLVNSTNRTFFIDHELNPSSGGENRMYAKVQTFYPSISTRLLSGCLGMNGSSRTNYNCSKTVGMPPITLTLYAVDEHGRRSNDINIRYTSMPFYNMARWSASGVFQTTTDSFSNGSSLITNYNTGDAFGNGGSTFQKSNTLGYEYGRTVSYLLNGFSRFINGGFDGRANVYDPDRSPGEYYRNSTNAKTIWRLAQ